MNEMVTAKTAWVWTAEAVEQNKYQKLEEGTHVWDNYKKEAPARWLEEGLIREATEEDAPVGQVAFDI